MRLIYQLTILFPSYNAQNGVPFLVGTNEREFLLTLWRLFLFNRRYLQKLCHHLQILCLLHPHTLKQTQFFVFIHILKYVILGIRVKITSGNFLSSASSSWKSKTNTNFCVHTYSGICFLEFLLHHPIEKSFPGCSIYGLMSFFLLGNNNVSFSLEHKPPQSKFL